jgi:hypothetical protein
VSAKATVTNTQTSFKIVSIANAPESIIEEGSRRNDGTAIGQLHSSAASAAGKRAGL